jgi:hypothetical protein
MDLNIAISKHIQLIDSITICRFKNKSVKKVRFNFIYLNEVFFVDLVKCNLGVSWCSIQGDGPQNIYDTFYYEIERNHLNTLIVHFENHEQHHALDYKNDMHE